MIATHLPPNEISNSISYVGTSSAVGMSLEDAARALNCSPNTIRRWIKQHRVRAERVSRPQGYEWRAYLEAAPTIVDTSQRERSRPSTSQVALEVPATAL